MLRVKRYCGVSIVGILVISLMGCQSSTDAPLSPETSASSEAVVSDQEVIIEPWTDYIPTQDAAVIENIRKNKSPYKHLYDVYHDLTVIDIHNHDADSPIALAKWGQYGIDRLVLFGDISEPSAKVTDKQAWDQYTNNPSRVYPSFAGFPIYEADGLDIVRQNLEQGYLNIGEVAAASSYSPVVSKVEWKAQHPNDGHLPKIYELAAEYQVPILLHIDPPIGEPIVHLEEALDQHPNTIIIFGHANAYNPPANIERLLEKHPNLYIDFFAGFTAYSSESTNKLEDFIPLIEQYSDRFMLSTDSGYGLSAELAGQALYDTIDLLTPETALKVSHQNYERLIERQPPTGTQIETIRTLSAQAGKFETYKLNKRMANELIFQLKEESD